MVYENDYLRSKYGDGSTVKNKKTTHIHTSVTKNTTRKSNYRLRKWILASSIVLILFLLLFGRPVYDTFFVVFSTIPSDIKQIGRDAGLSIQGQARFLSNSPEFVDADNLAIVCPHDQDIIEFGCYLPKDRKIYILQIDDSELQIIELTSVTHETLHAVWNDMPYDDKQKVGDDLTSFFNSSTSDILTEDAKLYESENSSNFVDELHSLTGSEVDLDSMPSSLSNYFSKYFSDQNKTVQANISFNQNIEIQTENLENQNEQIDTESIELDNFKIDHLDSIEAYMQQNLYYGDVYTYNKNVDAYNHNREIYNSMVDRYNANVDSYNYARDSFINAYSALFPGRTIPVPDAK